MHSLFLSRTQNTVCFGFLIQVALGTGAAHSNCSCFQVTSVDECHALSSVLQREVMKCQQIVQVRASAGGR